jgi:hypothetical protein
VRRRSSLSVGVIGCAYDYRERVYSNCADLVKIGCFQSLRRPRARDGYVINTRLDLIRQPHIDILHIVIGIDGIQKGFDFGLFRFTNADGILRPITQLRRLHGEAVGG